ncbi:hypothetical protein ACQYAD_02520 [Neobacillus sp. SM06]|uniref:hypothetical protein n=1 Tax=Neobacillus sp. SM06 TaxID=3422492 RepID=UPI003D27734B
MHHRVWTFVNLALIGFSIVYIWFFRPHTTSVLVWSQLFAQAAILLFFININMYFVFLLIRKTSVRKVKIRLAKISRFLMKWHIKMALLGTLAIVGHAAINLSKLAPIIGFFHVKVLTGYFAFALLLVTLFAGYLRHKRASGFRRRFHLISAMIFLLAFLLHMFTWV